MLNFNDSLLTIFLLSFLPSILNKFESYLYNLFPFLYIFFTVFKIHVISFSCIVITLNSEYIISFHYHFEIIFPLGKDEWSPNSELHNTRLKTYH